MLFGPGKFQPHGGAAFADAGAGSATITSSAITQNHTFKGNFIVIWIMSWPSKTLSALTIGGANASLSTGLLATVSNNNTAADGGLEAYVLPLTGFTKGTSQAIKATFSVAPSFGYLFSQSFYNVGSFDPMVTTFGGSGNPTMSGVTYQPGAIIAQGFCGYAIGSEALSAPKYTQRATNSQGSTVTCSFGDVPANTARSTGLSATTNNSGNLWSGITVSLESI